MPKISSLLAAVALTAFAGTVAAEAVAPGVVGFEFHKERALRSDYPHLSRRHSKRADTVQTALTNELSLYLINVTVGTPPQSFSLQIDTGSSDIWFPDSQAKLCQQNQCTEGEYDASQSSTIDNLNEPFEISYVDGTNIQGTYITDVLEIGGVSLTNVTMASATSLRAPAVGILGIGYRAGESISNSIAEGQGGALYNNLPLVLQNQGHINKVAYSLWLNDLDSSTGSILFGGVDKDKYMGEMVALPVQIDSMSEAITSFTVAWTGLTFTSGGKTSTLSPSGATPAILDSGTTELLLPDNIANEIFQGVGVITDENYGNLVKCSIGEDDAHFSFTFGGAGGAMVNVSLNEFAFPLVNEDGSPATFSDGSAACQFGIEAAGSDPILFGDTFLRSAYVVYDIQDNTIGIAQTDFNATGSNIVAFSSSGGIPGVTSTASSVTVTQTFSGNVEPTAEGTQVAGGTQIVGTSRSATFVLGTATGTSSSGGSSSSGAASGLRVPTIERSSIVAGVIAMTGFMFGGGLMLFL